MICVNGIIFVISRIAFGGFEKGAKGPSAWKSAQGTDRNDSVNAAFDL
jgi:hypothetical protein